MILAETPGGEPVSKVGIGFNTQALEVITRILESNATGQIERINGDSVHLVKSTHQAEIEYLAGPKKNRFPSFKRLIPTG